MQNLKRNAKALAFPQFASRSLRPLLFVVTTALLPSCGARGVDLDGDAGSVNVNSNPDAIAPGVSVVIEDQLSAMRVVVDENRVYWADGVPYGAATTVHAGVRSCLKNDCRSTITTYDTALFDKSGPFPNPYLDLAVADDNVYWLQQTDPGSSASILTCPSAGCSTGPRLIAKVRSSGNLGISLTADESFVYWVSFFDSAVLRFPVAGTGEPEAIALNQVNAAQIALSAGDVYWIEQALRPNAAIKRVSKRGGEPVTTFAMGQDNAVALSVDSDFVYWATSSSSGRVLRCPLSGCVTEPQVVVANQPSISALVARGKWASWMLSADGDPGGSGERRAAVVRHPIDGSDSAVETLAVQIFNFFGMSVAADDTHVYWVAQGIAEPAGSQFFPHATIYRYAN